MGITMKTRTGELKMNTQQTKSSNDPATSPATTETRRVEDVYDPNDPDILPVPFPGEAREKIRGLLLKLRNAGLGPRERSSTLLELRAALDDHVYHEQISALIHAVDQEFHEEELWLVREWACEALAKIPLFFCDESDAVKIQTHCKRLVSGPLRSSDIAPILRLLTDRPYNGHAVNALRSLRAFLGRRPFERLWEEFPERSGLDASYMNVGSIVVPPGRKSGEERHVLILATVIQEEGLVRPIRITNDRRVCSNDSIVLEACTRLGWRRVPVTIVDELDVA